MYTSYFLAGHQNLYICVCVAAYICYIFVYEKTHLVSLKMEKYRKNISQSKNIFKGEKSTGFDLQRFRFQAPVAMLKKYFLSIKQFLCC